MSKFSVMKRLLIFSVLMMAACNKDNLTVSPEMVRATVLDAGVNIPDGCGWQIRLADNSKIYHPQNLPDSFQKDNLEVLVDFVEARDSFYCGIASTAYPVMQINKIIQANDE
jgi:hypothetical protein